MYFSICVCVLFFFKQKTAYEMRISDWSSDVCSSDLLSRAQPSADPLPGRAARRVAPSRSGCVPRLPRFEARPRDLCPLRLFGALMLSPEEWSIVVLSLKVGGDAVLATLPLAFAIAWALARYRFPGRLLLDGFVHLPLVLPQIGRAHV